MLWWMLLLFHAWNPSMICYITGHVNVCLKACDELVNHILNVRHGWPLRYSSLSFDNLHIGGQMLRSSSINWPCVFHLQMKNNFRGAQSQLSCLHKSFIWPTMVSISSGLLRGRASHEHGKTRFSMRLGHRCFTHWIKIRWILRWSARRSLTPGDIRTFPSIPQPASVAVSYKLFIDRHHLRTECHGCLRFSQSTSALVGDLNSKASVQNMQAVNRSED